MTTAEEIIGYKVTDLGIEPCPLDEAEFYRLPKYNATIPCKLLDLLGIDGAVEWLNS